MAPDWPLLQKTVTRVLDLLEAGGEPGDVERITFLAWFFDAEVHNGGFDQYFFNSQGDHAAATVDALREIGALQAVDFLREAMALFGPEGPSKDRDVRWKQMDAIPNREAWNAIDERYYDSGESVPERLSDFLKARGVG